MTADRALSWHTLLEGGRPAGYEAVDLSAQGRAGYIVRRDPIAPRDRAWTLTAVVHGRDDQTRTGFDQKRTAQEAALNTRCHLCFRVRPFATLEPSGGMDGWRCRDREDCAAAEAAREEDRASIYRKIRDTDKEYIGVRDSEDGPELVFVTAGTGNRQVVQVTENDLIALTAELLGRTQSTIAAWLRRERP